MPEGRASTACFDKPWLMLVLFVAGDGHTFSIELSSTAFRALWQKLWSPNSDSSLAADSIKDDGKRDRRATTNDRGSRSTSFLFLLGPPAVALIIWCKILTLANNTCSQASPAVSSSTSIKACVLALTSGATCTKMSIPSEVACFLNECQEYLCNKLFCQSVYWKYAKLLCRFHSVAHRAIADRLTLDLKAGMLAFWRIA